MIRALVMGLVVTGCGVATLPGAPQLGTACDSSSQWQCYTSSSLAFCDDGRWAEYPCADACDPSSGRVCYLDVTAGEPCPASWAGAMYCIDAKTHATCTDGKWATRTCMACIPDSTRSACAQ